MAIDYYGIQATLAELLRSNVSELKNIFIEAMDRELTLDNMPCANVRLVTGEQVLRSLPNGYYLTLNFEIDIIAFHLIKFSEAATLRDRLMGAAQAVIQANAHFHTDLETSSLTPMIRFGALSPDGAGGQIALATFTLKCEAYIEAS